MSPRTGFLSSLALLIRNWLRFLGVCKLFLLVYGLYHLRRGHIGFGRSIEVKGTVMLPIITTASNAKNIVAFLLGLHIKATADIIIIIKGKVEE